jgi:hypothetical protein
MTIPIAVLSSGEQASLRARMMAFENRELELTAMPISIASSTPLLNLIVELRLKPHRFDHAAATTTPQEEPVIPPTDVLVAGSVSSANIPNKDKPR